MDGKVRVPRKKFIQGLRDGLEKRIALFNSSLEIERAGKEEELLTAEEWMDKYFKWAEENRGTSDLNSLIRAFLTTVE
jgi:hypothetical protein